MRENLATHMVLEELLYELLILLVISWILVIEVYICFSIVVILDVGSTNDIGTYSSDLNHVALYHNDNGMVILMFLKVAQINDE